MDFFYGILPHQIAGIAMLGVGALVAFLSRALAVHFEGKHADLAFKLSGLGVVIVGFILIML